MIDFKDTMNNLAATRPIFHSEADFQFALSWEIKSRHPSAEVRLEWRPHQYLGIDHVDILVSIASKKIGIELKYKTRALECMVGNEHYILKNQSAQDIARYDYLTDISRLESLKQEGIIKTGFAYGNNTI